MGIFGGLIGNKIKHIVITLVIKFAIGLTAFMSARELAHLEILHTWNAEIFVSITGLNGVVIGLFVGQET